MQKKESGIEIELDFSKSVEENAAIYFEKSKLARKKILGLNKAILIQKQKSENKLAEKEKKQLEERKKGWFEKYRWFFTSDGLLVVGGRDAHSNEEIVKKHMKQNDIYFHADVFGAPHCVIKLSDSKLKSVPEKSMLEVAQFAVVFSKAWEQGLASADAYSVLPEQVSKSAPSGMSLGGGAFMIYGERNWFKKTPLLAAIGYNSKQKTLMCGPLEAIKKNCSFFVELKLGTVNKNLVAKKLKEIFEKKGLIFPIETFISLLPNGGFEI